MNDVSEVKTQVVCIKCGSTDVLRDAYAAWNVDTQQWELSAVFDNAVCEGECGGDETRIEYEPADEDA